MRLQALALGAVVSLGTFLPGLALAQAMPNVQAKRELKFGARVTGFYDNNISRSSSSLSSVRNLSRDDYVLTPSVTVSLAQPFGRQVAFLKGDVGYSFYRYNSELDRRRASVSGGVAGILGPCRPIVFGGYDASQSDLANLDTATTSNLRQQVSVAAGASCARGVGPGVSFMVQRADVKNSAATVKESDATTETASIQLMFARPTLGTFVAGFNHSSTEYPNRINPGRPVGDGFFTQSYFVGYNRQFGSRLKVGAQGGVTHVKREFSPPGVDQSFNSMTYSADMTYGFGERIEFSANASRAVTPSLQVGKTFDKSTQATAILRYKAGERLVFESGYTWQTVDANADTAAALLVVTNSETNAVYGSVSFSPNDRVSFGLNVRYEEREANLSQFSYNATRVGVSAQTSF
jgi:hypothetical protein